MKEKKQAEAQGMDGLEYAPWACHRVEEYCESVRRKQMKREIAYFCPQCMSNELSFGSVMDSSSSVGASCALCGWSGRSTEVVGAVSPANAQFWNAEKLGNVMLIAMAKHGAGPLIQVLELLGIMPPVPGSDEGTMTPERAEEAQSAQECRDRVMQAVVGAAVTAAFETAAEVSASHYARYNPEQGAAVDKVFQFSETGEQRVH